MVAKKLKLEIIYFLFKDRNLLYALGFFYVLMLMIFMFCLEFRYDSIYFGTFIIILFVATISVQVILFLSMLIKIFSKPNTHQLTSFLGLFIGIFVCFIWYAILKGYFEISYWGLNGIGLQIVSYLPCVLSIYGYILLIFIKVIRSCIYLLVKKQNN